MGSNDLHWLNKKSKLKRESKLIKEYADSLLIVCEGEQTEPNYFEGFQTSGVKVKVLGKGYNTISLVKDAISEWKKFAKEGKYFEKLWCVFDRDDFPQINYNLAFASVIIEEQKLNRRYKKKTGREISINIAYSNEAFEFWYLLHFDYHTTGHNRSRFKNMLTKRLNKTYQKNSPDMYDILLELSIRTNGKQGQEFALRNAAKLRTNINGVQPHNNNPSTSVDQLVIELNKHLKK